jgi:ribose-phosphate pyrophosphokinase
MKILSCNSNHPLAEAIASYLNLALTSATIRRFSDMEVFVEIHENVRGEDVFVIQSTSFPVNDNLMELLFTLDALRRGSARRPTAGADRVVTIDLHSGQIQGFFDIPLDNLYAAPVFSNDIQNRFQDERPMIVSPDVGGVVRARIIARRLDADLAIIDKRRERAGVSEVMNIIGDVRKRRCILIDDIVDSAGTLCNAAEALTKAGATSVCAYVTHGVLSGGAVARVTASPLESLVTTDSIQATEAVRIAHNIRHLSIAPLMAESIQRISEERSVSSLFD